MKKSFIEAIFIIFLLLFSFTNSINASNISYENSQEIGDLLFCGVKPGVDFDFSRVGISNDHVALCIGDNKYIHSIPVLGVVVWTSAEMQTCFEKFVYATIPSASETAKENAAL